MYWTAPPHNFSHQPVINNIFKQFTYTNFNILVPAGDHEWSFVVNFETVAIRFSCNSRATMEEWVDCIRNKLGEMGILNPKGNLYSKVPTNPSPTKTRNPMSPLPQPPPVPGTYYKLYCCCNVDWFFEPKVWSEFRVTCFKRFIFFIKEIDLMLLLTHVCTLTILS